MGLRVVVIGGGIIGCSASALLAEAGAEVTLLEASGVGAGASGRNSGTIQHPFDPVLLLLHRDTVEAYRTLAERDPDFGFPAEPAGVLLLTDDLAAATERASELATAFPDLVPEVLDATAVARPGTDPRGGLGGGAGGDRLPGRPRSGNPGDGSAGAARRRGAQDRPRRRDHGSTVGSPGRGVRGWRTPRRGRRLVAGGPWTPEILGLDPAWPPVTRTWGVTVQVDLPDPPRHILEEGVVHTINVPSGHAGSLFSMVTAGGVATVGSTFMATEPDPAELAPMLIERGAAFVPRLADAHIRDVRLCARPQSADGRPFIGPVPNVQGLYLCAGHGPWGMSTGPGSAALVVEQILGEADRVPVALRADRTI